MADDDDANRLAADEEANGVGEDSEEGEEYSSASSSDYDSEDSSSDEDGGGGGGEGGGGGGGGRYDSKQDELEEDNPEDANFRAFSEILDSRSYRKKEEEEVRGIVPLEDHYDFPIDKENWCEEDLGELWDDAPLKMTKPGWDPDFADDDDWDAVIDEVKDGGDPPIAPFYLPYRKHCPVIPDNHYDISNAKAVIEELDRTEEFLIWVSFIFEDGSSYEGTVWDDLAQGKGVYLAEDGLVRYEGEWLQNQMEGHGVVEVDIPAAEPIPGSKLEAKMRAEGKIISRDFMSPEDRKWLEMDIEDSLYLADGQREIPFYERNEWIQIFGEKPEKGRYRYAGQWKHGRMHGCGVYEVNERILSGRFYFGRFVGDSTGCDSDVSTLHAGIAEVAAAKARMFANKPDGMVREERGPYSDPQHPYFYEEDDVWMAPGFVNQFYDVPNYWKTYVEEVDQERGMWLNSFYKAPLRLPMPAELEYWWEKGEVTPEFILINKEPDPDPDDPSKLVYTDDPLILHTPTGRLINYVDDEKYGVRMFWQPVLKEGEDVDPDKAHFLPLGFDDFYGRSGPVEKKEGPVRGLITSIQNTFKPLLDGLGHWAKEKLEASEMKLKLIENQLEFVEAEITLEEEIEDLDRELKRKQEEEEKQGVADENQDDAPASATVQDEAVPEEMEDEDEDDDEEGPTSFGSVNQGRKDNDTSAKGNKPGKFPFSSLSLSLLHSGPLSMVPIKLQESFRSWRNRCSSGTEQSSYEFREQATNAQKRFCSIKFNGRISQSGKLRVMQQRQHSNTKRQNCSSLNSLASVLLVNRRKNQIDWAIKSSVGINELSILSLHVPVMDAVA